MKHPTNLIPAKVRLVLTCAAFIFWFSGCTHYYAAVLRDTGAAQSARVEAAQALRNEYWSDAVIDALLMGLADADPTIRYFAAESLERQALIYDPRSRRVCEALLLRLDDRAIGRWSKRPLFALIWAERLTGPIRTRALLTLSAITSKDHGFDIAAWRAEFDKFWPTKPVSDPVPTQ